MTCIVGLTYNGGAIMAGDGLLSLGGTQLACGEPKIHKQGKLIIGASGTGRECDLILTAPLPKPRLTDPYGWAVEKVVPMLWKRFGDAGLLDSSSSPLEAMMLLAVPGTLLGIDSQGGVFSYLDGYGAIGSGMDIAMGVLAGTAQCQPITRIARVITACNTHCAGVGDPWTIETI